MKSGLYPGASLAVYRAGAWEEHYVGQSDPARNQETRADLLYDLASVSKVVGVGTLLLVAMGQGLVELDQTFQTYQPQFRHSQITIRQLLTHTSGLDPFIPNRDTLSAEQLKAALYQLDLRESQAFHYTDVNFLLLGFLVEDIYGASLNQVFDQEIFRPWQMKDTSFGPRLGAVPTVRGHDEGLVHDPKARVLGVHAGSAGLFSTIHDLKLFLEHYLQDDFAKDLFQNFSQEEGKTRSLAWNLEGDWLDHTGYTGPFIMVNRKRQEAVIFLTNRTYDRDDRPRWIEERRKLCDVIKLCLETR
ncbi:serine hydrolase [Streptococcus himalayensis]|uniref:Serine hydrolase n=2 Tax=Streptococcus himalayensis TaxID=1888195 RepID=A0A917A8U3_9STRE|nr:serine hydrolase [Streptococcus himalayensis]